jgi:hypothetical protein
MTKNIIPVIESVVNVKNGDLSINEKGHGKFSLRAGSRICNIHHSSLQHQFSKTTSKLYCKLTEAGFDPKNFTVSGIPDIAMGIVVDYYAHEAGFNCTEQAKQAQRIFASIGVRTWCQKVLSWNGVKDNDKEYVHLERTLKKEIKNLNPIEKPKPTVNVNLHKHKLKPEEVVEQELLSCYTDALSQVSVLTGVIDVLTKNEIIEIKDVRKWKGGLGQVLVYGRQYSNHKKRLHLFGKVNEETKQIIENECSYFDVRVTWHSDFVKPKLPTFNSTRKQINHQV